MHSCRFSHNSNPAATIDPNRSGTDVACTVTPTDRPHVSTREIGHEDHQLKVTLQHIKPNIWRRIQVRSNSTLYKLHYTLQIVMGWPDSHMHQFVVDGVLYGESTPNFDFNVVSERRTPLSDLVSA